MPFSEEGPIFLQLAEQLEDAILSGAYPEETQIPSITEYSLLYKINPATALKGINLLVDAGLLYKKRGVGMFVVKGAQEQLAKRRQADFYRDYVLPLSREAQRLGLRKEELENLIERGLNEHED